jgi:DNA-binding NarL/FixJ family response regulator
MLGFVAGMPSLLVGAVVGLLLLGFAFAGWRMRCRLVKATTDIVQLRQVVQDLISIQEYRLAKLKAEIEGPQPAAPRKMASAPPRTSEVSERRRHIWDLAAKGLTAEEIARRMRLPHGQVEVLLNMRSYSDTLQV